jgi:large subunit ribosomal protein L1
MLPICRSPLRQGSIAAPLFSNYQQVRGKASAPQKGGKKGAKDKAADKKKKGPRDYAQVDLSQMEQFALCDAMR